VLAAYVDGDAQPQRSLRGTTQVHNTGRLTHQRGTLFVFDQRPGWERRSSG
jgi:hypothetical protein